jgi:hypothetical protein
MYPVVHKKKKDSGSSISICCTRSWRLKKNGKLFREICPLITLYGHMVGLKKEQGGEGGREEGRKGGREEGEEGRKGGRGGREEGREEGKKGGRKGGREE